MSRPWWKVELEAREEERSQLVVRFVVYLVVTDAAVVSPLIQGRVAVTKKVDWKKTSLVNHFLLHYY